MKKIIKNKVYDTDTAKLICREVSDNGFIKELYQKKTGHYFVYHKIPTSNGTITPITYDDAAEIASNLMSDDDYKTTFMGNPDDFKTVTTNIYKSASVKLKHRASESNSNIADVINNLIMMEDLFMSKINFTNGSLDREVQNIIANIQDACYNTPYGCVVTVHSMPNGFENSELQYKFAVDVREIDYNNNIEYDDTCDVHTEDGFNVCSTDVLVCVYGANGDFDEDKMKNERKAVEAIIREKLIMACNKSMGLIAKNK